MIEPRDFESDEDISYILQYFNLGWINYGRSSGLKAAITAVRELRAASDYKWRVLKQVVTYEEIHEEPQ